jgi:hypothetical protein
MKLANFIENLPRKASPLKPLCQMKRNLVGSIYGRSSVKLTHFVPITKFQFIWPSSFREEDLKKSTNQKQELPMTTMFVNGSE